MSTCKTFEENNAIASFSFFFFFFSFRGARDVKVITGGADEKKQKTKKCINKHNSHLR